MSFSSPFFAASVSLSSSICSSFSSFSSNHDSTARRNSFSFPKTRSPTVLYLPSTSLLASLIVSMLRLHAYTTAFLTSFVTVGSHFSSNPLFLMWSRATCSQSVVPTPTTILFSGSRSTRVS